MLSRGQHSKDTLNAHSNDVYQGSLSITAKGTDCTQSNSTNILSQCMTPRQNIIQPQKSITSFKVPMKRIFFCVMSKNSYVIKVLYTIALQWFVAIDGLHLT